MSLLEDADKILCWKCPPCHNEHRRKCLVACVFFSYCHQLKRLKAWLTAMNWFHLSVICLNEENLACFSGSPWHHLWTKKTFFSNFLKLLFFSLKKYRLVSIYRSETFIKTKHRTKVLQMKDIDFITFLYPDIPMIVSTQSSSTWDERDASNLRILFILTIKISSFRLTS